MRAKLDTQRSRNGLIIRIATWVVIIVVLGIVGPPIYRAGYGAYMQFHLKSVRENVMKGCGGPITDSTAPYLKDQITKCVTTSNDLQKAESDYADFTKGTKP